MARSSALAVVLLLCVAGTALAAGSRDPSIDEVISTLKALKASSSVPSRASAAARVAAASATPAGRPAAVRAAAAYLDAAPEIVFDSSDEESAYPLPDAALAGASAAMDAITPPAAAADAAAPSSGNVAAQGAAAEPQHAPQFPVEDASKQQAAGKRPISSVPATPAPLPAKEPVQQQPAQQQKPAAAAPQKPAAAAPQKPAAAAPQKPTAVPVPAPAPQQKQAAPVTPPKAATPAPAAAAPKKAEAPQQPAAEAPKPAEAPKQQEPEDPCKKIPGCLSCKAQGATGHSFTRKLRQFGHGGHAGHHNSMGMDSLNGASEQKQGKPNFDLSSMYDSVYNAKDLPYCSACNTTAGYVAHSKGRCGAWVWRVPC
jgi:hypothetical protein